MRIFVNPVGNSKGLGEKRKIRTGGELTIVEFRGYGGVMHFGISEGKGGLKYGSRPSVGTDIFWNCPFSNDTGKLGQRNSECSHQESNLTDLPITSSYAPPLSYRRLMGAKAIKL